MSLRLAVEIRQSRVYNIASSPFVNPYLSLYALKLSRSQYKTHMMRPALRQSSMYFAMVMFPGNPVSGFAPLASSHPLNGDAHFVKRRREPSDLVVAHDGPLMAKSPCAMRRVASLSFRRGMSTVLDSSMANARAGQ